MGCAVYTHVYTHGALHCRFGDIGQRVAVLARAYGMRVVALRRHVERSQAELDSGLLVGCRHAGRRAGGCAFGQDVRALQAVTMRSPEHAV